MTIGEISTIHRYKTTNMNTGFVRCNIMGKDSTMLKGKNI